MKHFVLGLIGVCCVPGMAVHATYLYIADDKDAAIYGIDVEADNPEPVLISGTYPLVASRAVSLDRNRVAFLPSIPEYDENGRALFSRIFEYNRITEEVATILEVGEGRSVIDLQMMDGGSTLTALLEGISGFEIHQGTRGQAGWSFQPLDFPALDAVDVNFGGASFKVLSDGTAVLLAKPAGSFFQHLIVLEPDANEPGFFPLETLKARSPQLAVTLGDQVVLTDFPFPIPGNQALVFDHAGGTSRVLTMGLPSDPFQSYLEQESFPDVANLFGPAGIYEGPPISSLAPDDSYSVAVLPPTPTVFGPIYDFTSIRDPLRVNESEWQFHEESSGHLLTVDGSPEETVISPAIFAQRGSGPPLRMPQDIVTRGMQLFVLDGGKVPYRIVEVDPVSGDREVRAVLDQAEYLAMERGASGGFLLLGNRFDRESRRYLNVLHEVMLTDDPHAPTVTVVAETEWEATVADLTTSNEGVPYVLRWAARPGNLLRATGGGLETVGTVRGPEVPMTEVFNSDNFLFAESTYPTGAVPEPSLIRLLILSDYRFQPEEVLVFPPGSPDPVEFASPETAPYRDAEPYVPVLGGESSVLSTRLILPLNRDQFADPSGLWRVEIPLPFSSGDEFTVQMEVYGERTLHFIEFNAQDELIGFLHRPPAMGLVDQANGSVQRIEVTEADQMLLESIDRSSDMTLHGERIFLALTDKPEVVELRYEAGNDQATFVRQWSSRPANLDVEVLAPEDHGNRKLAVGNPPFEVEVHWYLY